MQFISLIILRMLILLRREIGIADRKIRIAWYYLHIAYRHETDLLRIDDNRKFSNGLFIYKINNKHEISYDFYLKIKVISFLSC